jgi:hypothetical protein
MRIAPRTLGQFVVATLIVLVLLLLCLPFFQKIHWVGSTDLEIDFLVIDSMSGTPIPGSTLEIHSEGGFYEDRSPQDFTLVTDQDGIAKRVCLNTMCFGTSGWNIDTYVVHLPWWTYKVSATGYRATEPINLDTLENVQKVKRGKPAMLLVDIPLQKPGVE